MNNRRTRWFRRFFRVIARVMVRLLTRTTFTGVEHFQTPGPVIYSANHASTFDPVLLLMLMSPEAIFVGPGDFELLWPANWIIKLTGLIPMKRGSVDREGLKLLLAALKDGGKLGMFPEGGTWEKPLDEVKSGVAYLSNATGARIVPFGLGGTYQVWRQIALLRFPRITVNIGPPLPPVEVPRERSRRQDALQAASVDLMHTIYDLLPPDTQARYDRLARERYAGTLTFRPAVVDPPDVSLDALAELVIKPNLFSPLVYNARLPVRPFVRHGRYFAPRRVRTACTALLDAFAEGDFSGYLEYRLGEAKADSVRVALAAVRDAATAAEAAGASVAFTPTVALISDPE